MLAVCNSLRQTANINKCTNVMFTIALVNHNETHNQTVSCFVQHICEIPQDLHDGSCLTGSHGTCQKQSGTSCHPLLIIWSCASTLVFWWQATVTRDRYMAVHLKPEFVNIFFCSHSRISMLSSIKSWVTWRIPAPELHEWSTTILVR